MDLKKLKLEYPYVSEVIEIKGKWDYETYYGDECCSDCLICLEDCHCEESSGSIYESVFKYEVDGDVDRDIIAFDADENVLVFELEDNRTAIINEIFHDIYVFDNDKMCDGVVEGCYDFTDYDTIDGVCNRKIGSKNKWIK